jgi:hypothetical protein
MNNEFAQSPTALLPQPPLLSSRKTPRRLSPADNSAIVMFVPIHLHYIQPDDTVSNASFLKKAIFP